jgi:hypothetical protein
MMTREGKIGWAVAASVLLRNDVFDVKAKEGLLVLVEAAVFTAPRRTRPD